MISTGLANYTLNSRFTFHLSRFTFDVSPFTIDHSPFTMHHSRFTIHELSDFPHLENTIYNKKRMAAPGKAAEVFFIMKPEFFTGIYH
jgi:hypothetical protein